MEISVTEFEQTLLRNLERLEACLEEAQGYAENVRRLFLMRSHQHACDLSHVVHEPLERSS
jgi:hypothetical protein